MDGFRLKVESSSVFCQCYWIKSDDTIRRLEHRFLIGSKEPVSSISTFFDFVNHILHGNYRRQKPKISRSHSGRNAPVNQPLEFQSSSYQKQYRLVDLVMVSYQEEVIASRISAQQAVRTDDRLSSVSECVLP